MRLPFDKPTRTWLKRIGLAVWLVAVAALVFLQVRDLEWPKVLEALRSFGPARIAAGAAFVLPACAAVAFFDLIGRNATGHGLPVPRVMLISFTGYFFSLNLGALVGGLAFRYRLYMPYRLPPVTISQVIGLSVVTNWSGYVLIAGAVLLFQPPELPPDWGLGPGLLRGTGALLLAAAAAYLVLCAIRGGDCIRWKGSAFELPTLGIAALQIGLSVLSWASIGAVIAALLPGEASWLAVMPVLMISALAGIWSHVPGGLGVIEAVFLALLDTSAPAGEVVAAILVYRLLYYVAPFALAIAAYAFLETGGRPPPRRSGKVA
ncbi:MAG TPA: lysylphosphatidylglycerol synthase domain-containing protein [Woeseiaceae bacterium]|nr:lysylphosphatidylglycerol synthase domain-containing protein [Woeseiaceae bacterium]